MIDSEMVHDNGRVIDNKLSSILVRSASKSFALL
jgi:hypothetical protein